MDIKNLLNKTAAGQIALNLDAQGDGGQDGKITKSVWDTFWAQHGGDECKGRHENVDSEGVSVQDAVKLIMTRIFNYVNKHGGNVDEVGNQFFNSIENHKRIDAGTVSGIDNTPVDDKGKTEDAKGAGDAGSTDGAKGADGKDKTKEPPQTQKYTTDSIKVKVQSRDNKDKLQRAFDAANQLLVDVANKPPAPEKIVPTYSKELNKDGKRTELPDGRVIEVAYNRKGEIECITITQFDAEDKPECVVYSKTGCHFDNESNDQRNTIDPIPTSGYNWNKLVKIAESIFGKGPAAAQE